MATQVQWRGGSTAEHAAFTGAAREVTVDTQKKTLVVHDGSTAGGEPLLREDQANLPTSVTNGISVPSANNVAISTNGTGKLFIDSAGKVTVKGVGTAAFVVEGTAPDNSLVVKGSTGNVGLGSSTPDGTLHVQGTNSGGTLEALVLRNNATTAGTQTAIRFTNSTGAFNHASIVGTRSGTGALDFYTAGSATPAMSIDSSSRVGVGTTSPGNRLTVIDRTTPIALKIGENNNATTAAGLEIQARNTVNTTGYALQIAVDADEAAATIDFNGSERARIDSSGTFYVVGAGTGGVNYAASFSGSAPVNSLNLDSSGRLLVGTSSARSNFAGNTATPLVQIEGVTAATASSSVVRGAADSTGPTFNLGKTRGALVNQHTAVVSGDQCGVITFQGADGTNLLRAAQIAAEVDNGAAGTALTGSEMPGRLVFSTTADGSSSPTPRVTIDSSGRLLVGAPTARANFYNSTISALFQQEGATSTGDPASRFMSLTYGKGNNDSGVFIFAKHRATTVGVQPVVVIDGDFLGELNFQGSDGTEFVQAASIRAAVDGPPSANIMPGRLVFSTTADGASSPTERMRITSGGIVGIGNLGATNTSSAQSGVPASFWLSATGTTSNPPAEFYGNATSTRHHVAFSNGNGVVGSISTNASATAYNTSSDYRLKENVVEVTDGITRLQQLKPSRFNFIADPDKTVDGFIAHEVQTVVPEAITGEKDAVDDEGKPIYQGIDQSKLVPLLTAALQEAVAKIESLEARLDAANL